MKRQDPVRHQPTHGDLVVNEPVNGLVRELCSGIARAGLEEVQLTGRVWGRMHHGSLAKLKQDVVNAQLAVQLRIQLHRDNSLRNGVATHATIICADRPPARGPRRLGARDGLSPGRSAARRTGFRRRRPTGGGVPGRQAPS